MRSFVAAVLLGTVSLTALSAAAEPSKDWIAKSNAYTQKLLDVDLKHSPEEGSNEGLAKFDKLIGDPRMSDDLAERKELQAALADIKAKGAKETDPNLKQDLAILDKAFELRFRQENFAWDHEVQFFNASAQIFRGLQVLLDDQVAAERRPAALVRLKKYAGLEKGMKAYTELLKERTLEQIAKPGVIYPAKAEMDIELGRNPNYVSGIADLFKKYGIKDWEKPYAVLQKQLKEYDDWLRQTVLPKARTDFRLPPEKYAMNFESYGIDIPPAQIAEMAHKAFTEIQGQMQTVAAQVAKEKGYANPDYRAVIAELKKNQITGDAIMPFYEARLHAIEAIIREKNLITLPDRPAIIRLATAAETVQTPAPHMVPPPFLHNTGQRGQFVLPLNIPAASGEAEADKYDDFTYDAVGWTLTAHEARPGHELQFDSMVEQGVSLARALYAFNSTNAEGWGLYSEYVMQPYEPAEGQLLTLDLRLLRAARAILDPELQSGKVTTDQAYQMLEKNVVLSHAFAKEEVERFTFKAPGQANSYFYGYTKLLALRQETEAALGAKFDQKKFHDFILAQGLLPPDLMHKAVVESFIPSQK
jgi:uncharacterized protein (DUF885 family)